MTTFADTAWALASGLLWLWEWLLVLGAACVAIYAVTLLLASGAVGVLAQFDRRQRVTDRQSPGGGG